MTARETLLDHQFLVNFFGAFILKKKGGMLEKSFQFFRAINRVYIGCGQYSSLYAAELIVYSFCHFLTEIFGNIRQFSGTSHVNILANELVEY